MFRRRTYRSPGNTERWFEEKNLVEYNSHIEFLRNLQNLRSSGTGHRKGSNYDKISKEQTTERLDVI